MNIKPKTNHLIIIGATIIGLAMLTILASGLVRPKDTSAGTAPTVGLLETVDDKLIVHAKSNSSGGDKETFVYCLSRQDSSSNCAWDNSDEFDLTEPGDYYVYVKSLASGKISDSKLFTYEPVDTTKVKM